MGHTEDVPLYLFQISRLCVGPLSPSLPGGVCRLAWDEGPRVGDRNIASVLVRGWDTRPQDLEINSTPPVLLDALTYTIPIIPEPSTATLLSLGLVGIAAVRRRRAAT